MGAGGGLGALAMRMGRVAIPVVRNYILPVAKQVGKNLLEAAIPEIGNALTGKKRPSGKMLKNVAEAAAKRTVKTTASALEAGGTPRQARQPGGRTSGGSTARGRARGTTLQKRRINVPTAPSSDSTTTPTISKSNRAKRSRSDILSEIQFA